MSPKSTDRPASAVTQRFARANLTATGRLRALGLLVLGLVIELGLAGCGSLGAFTAKSELPAQMPGPKPAAVAKFDEAVAALRRDDEAKATTLFEQLVSDYPDYSGPMVNLALIRARHDDAAAAMELLQRAMAVCSHCAPVHNQMGVLLRQQGRFAEAEKSYQSAISADAAYAPAHFNLAVLYELYLRRQDLAAAEYGHYMELASDPTLTGDVNKWLTDLKRRSGGTSKSAAAEQAP